MIAIAVAVAATPVPLACGAATRPGIAERGEDGVWRGRAVDLCRAVAARAGGPDAPIEFHSYDDPAALRAAARDRIAFVSADEFAAAPGLRAGPPIADDRQVIAVKTASPIRAPRDVAGAMVCFIVGTRAEGALNAWALRDGVAIERLAFQEPDEMRDAFDVGKCAAMAIDAAEIGGDAGLRALAPVLAVTPVIASTPSTVPDAWRDEVAAVAAALGPYLSTSSRK